MHAPVLHLPRSSRCVLYGFVRALAGGGKEGASWMDASCMESNYLVRRSLRSVGGCYSALAPATHTQRRASGQWGWVWHQCYITRYCPIRQHAMQDCARQDKTPRRCRMERRGDDDGEMVRWWSPDRDILSNPTTPVTMYGMKVMPLQQQTQTTDLSLSLSLSLWSVGPLLKHIA